MATERDSGRDRTMKTLGLVLMGIFVVLYLVPVFGVILTSLKTNTEIAQRGIWTLTGDVTFDNYVTAWTDSPIKQYLWNTVLVTVPAVVLSIAGGSMLGYAVAILKPRGANVLLLLVVGGLFVPPQVLLVPLFRIFSDVGLINTLWPMILIHSAIGLAITTLMMSNFFSQVPRSLREAAIVDGAHEGTVFTRIMIPLARPSLAALATLQFAFIWNDFLYPLVFTSTDNTRTIMLGLIALRGQFAVAYGSQAAVAVIASLPTVLVFLFFQKQFIRGLTAGATKG
jgi:multiple sugar transport system permease protein